MKIVEYIPFIKNEFANISKTFKLEWSNDNNEYLLKLENDKIKISFFSEQRGEDIGIVLINKDKNEFYYNFPLLKGFNGFYEGLTASERANERAFNDGLEATVFLFRVFLENHCQDMLSGDFSQVGPGNPN